MPISGTVLNVCVTVAHTQASVSYPTVPKRAHPHRVHTTAHLRHHGDQQVDENDWRQQVVDDEQGQRKPRCLPVVVTHMLATTKHSIHHSHASAYIRCQEVIHVKVTKVHGEDGEDLGGELLVSAANVQLVHAGAVGGVGRAAALT